MPDTREDLKAIAPLALYANYFNIGHNAYEFLIDFGQFCPERDDVTLHTRIVFGPVHARVLAELLSAALQQYEKEHSGG